MDLTTRYMGLQLKNPLVASASPLTAEPDNIRRLEDAGAAAVVLPSLFQEDIEAETARHDLLTSAGEDSWPEAHTNFPPGADYRLGPKEYLDLVRKASAAVEIPVIASLNGITNEGWIYYAKLIEEAGAKGLELDIYFIPADLVGNRVMTSSGVISISSGSCGQWCRYPWPSNSAPISARSAVLRARCRTPVPTLRAV